MQTVCKAVRKQAVCGSKPGGSTAYDLRESCVKKDRAAANASRRSSKSATTKILELSKFYMKEIKQLADRKDDIKDLSLDIPATFEPGLDHRLVEFYIGKARQSQNMTVRARIKKACDDLNSRLRTPALDFTRGLEMLVIAGAIAHYKQAMKDVAS